MITTFAVLKNKYNPLNYILFKVDFQALDKK